MKDKKALKRFEIKGFLFSSLLGVLLHFAYKFSNKLFIVGLFTPVNESSWEHLKLMFFPFMLYAIYEAHKLENDKFNVYFAKLFSVLIGMFTTLGLFYIANGGFGKTQAFYNIIAYFIGMAVSSLLSYHIIKYSFGKGFLNGFSFGLMFVLGIIFIYFTIYPPHISLFQDPINQTYGILK